MTLRAQVTLAKAHRLTQPYVSDRMPRAGLPPSRWENMRCSGRCRTITVENAWKFAAYSYLAAVPGG